ncbi:MAG: hypothetical protein AB7F99_04260 [Vicinamibacterales bacterium]
MTEIRVPRTPRSAFNKNRPASELLRNQVKQLEAVAERLPGAKDNPLPNATRVKTEGQVADFIRKVARVLNPEAAQQTAGAGAPPVAGAGVPAQDAPAASTAALPARQRRRALENAKATKNTRNRKGTKTKTKTKTKAKAKAKGRKKRTRKAVKPAPAARMRGRKTVSRKRAKRRSGR